MAPEELLDALHTRYLRGELAALAAHACGNFVVQALAGAALRPQQVRSVRGSTQLCIYLHTSSSLAFISFGMEPVHQLSGANEELMALAAFNCINLSQA